MKHQFLTTILPVLLLIAGAHGEPKVAEDTAALDDKTPLKVGDMVRVQIVEAKDAGLQHKVREDGMLRVPVLGDQRAAGLTAKALAEDLKTKLEKKFFKTATVRVERVTDPKAEESSFYTFEGKKYDLELGEELTVSQALLRYGNFGFRSPRYVTVIRQTAEGVVRLKVNVDEVMKRGKLEKDIRILPGDVIEIPQKVFKF